MLTSCWRRPGSCGSASPWPKKKSDLDYISGGFKDVFWIFTRDPWWFHDPILTFFFHTFQMGWWKTTNYSRPSRDLIGTLRPILHQRVCSSSVWRLALSLGQCSQWGQPWGRRMKRTTAVEGFGRSHLQDGKVGENILQFSNCRIDYMRFTMFIFVHQLFKMIWWSSFSLPHHHTSQGSKGIKKSSGGSPPPDHQPVFLGHVRRQWCVRLMAFWPRALSLAIAIRVAFFLGGGGYFGTMTCNLIYSSSLRNWNWICFSCNVYSYFVRSSWHVLRSSGRWDPIRARAWGGKRGKSSPKKVGSCSKSGRKLWWKVFSSASKSHYRESPSDCFWRQGKRKFGGWKLPLETNRLSTRKDYGTLGRFKFSLVGRVECGIGAMIVLCFNCPSIQSKWFSLA